MISRVSALKAERDKARAHCAQLVADYGERGDLLAECRVRVSELEALLADAAPFVEFFRDVWKAWIDDCTTIDGSDLQELLVKSALVEPQPYDPEVHGARVEADEGEPIFVLTDSATALLAKLKAARTGEK